jgi:hypothetical protein
MAAIENQHTELNQPNTIRLFNMPLTESETENLKNVLVNHYSALLEEEVNNVITEKSYDQKDFDDMLNGTN